MFHQARTPRSDGLEARGHLRRLWQQQGAAELVRRTGWPESLVADFVDGAASPDMGQRRLLETVFGIPADAWGRLP